VGAIALTAAIVTVQDSTMVQLLERNAQTSFFDLRGPVTPPGNNPATPTEPEIVILAMDGETMTQGTQIYPTDPQQYAYFESIQQWPWQRTAYAIAIDRLMQAGARAVVLDVVLDANSSYGDTDDEQLQQVLRKYPGRVTLAAKYVEEEKRTGTEIQLLAPNPIFRSAEPVLGFINLTISPNGRMHELGSLYLQQVQQFYQPLGVSVPEIPSFAEAALKSAGISYSPPKGQDIFFYGPSQTFEHIPFWHVLDPQNWNGYHLKNQTFKDKIVLIGPTGGGESFQDFHQAPFSGTLRYPEKMAGVEIQANAIATLMQGQALTPAFTNLYWKGLFVASLVLAAGYLQSRKHEQLNLSRQLRRFGYGLVIALGYGIFSYTVFVHGRLILPTAVPMIAIATSSATSLAMGILRYQKRLRKDAKRIPDTHTSQETGSDFETPDMQEAIEERQKAFIGTKLDGRYQIQQKIGVGGFGETYRAYDLKRPGNPVCVVKRLRPANRSPRVIKLAQKLFREEARVLERLGQHNQIPQLLTYLEEQNQDEFYLVQEYIDGTSLADELSLHKLYRPLSEHAVVMILYDLLHILEFVHQQGVIHRDIKPANVIRRKSDRKLVLIDFGAVKQIQELEELEDGTVLTVPIGTNGYMAPEQALGTPCLASDIYSLGRMGIQALTGIEAKNLDTNQTSPNGGVNWKNHVQASDALVQILEKMTRVDVSDRYTTVQEVMATLQPLVEFAQKSGYTPEFLEWQTTPEEEDLSATGETKQWMIDLPKVQLPPTDPDEPESDINTAETQVWQEQNPSQPDDEDDSATGTAV